MSITDPMNLIWVMPAQGNDVYKEFVDAVPCGAAILYFDMQTKRFDLSVYIITDQQTIGDRSLFDVVRAAIRGGATLVQLRDKHASDSDMIAVGKQLHQITQAANIPLIVNDRLDVALALDAEGLHIGQGDMAAAVARRLIGPNRILGVSAATIAEAQCAEYDGADYLGVGDVYGTLSKPDADIPIGIDGLRAVIQAVALPVVAIGGITLEHTPDIIRAGAEGVAVISAVVGAANAEIAARRLRTIVDEHKDRVGVA